jgi:ribonuclease D
LIVDALGLADACAQLSGCVALDTEFHSERRHFPDLFLVQLCATGCQPVLIDVRATPDLTPLGDALANCEVLLHGGERDLQLLNLQAGLVPRNVVDTQILAGFVGLGYPRRLEDLTAEVLGHAPPVGRTGLSDWSRRPLSATQLAYAAGDVTCLHELHEELKLRASPNQLRWAEKTTADHVDRWLTPQDPEGIWRWIPAALIMNQRERERLRVLAAWRFREAAARNLGPWNVASDRVLTDLARRAPTSVKALAANRLTPKGLVRRYGQTLVDLLETAPSVHLQPLASTPKARAAEALILSWAYSIEARTGIAARLVLPPSRLQAWLSSWLAGESIQITPHWLREAFGPELQRLLQGDLALALHAQSGSRPAFSENI